MCNYNCKIMINRINLILRAKNITARQFAEEIGIQPSGMSHILGGRNNPSLDFAVKVLKRYPEIDANWLLLGKGAMYGNSGVTAVEALHETAHDDGFVDKEAMPETTVEPYHETAHDDGFVAREPLQEMAQEEAASVVEEPFHETAMQEGGQQVVRVMMIYSDNTYEVLTPRV